MTKTPLPSHIKQVNLTIQWDTQHDSPNQSTFVEVPYTQLTCAAALGREGGDEGEGGRGVGAWGLGLVYKLVPVTVSLARLKTHHPFHLPPPGAART
jgi:hypothetical protein